MRLIWVGPDQFVFEKDPNDPLYFQRSNGERIVPETIYTDGGSIPRPMWVFRNYSPWGYGPAFVIHDWLFSTHYCRTPGYEKYTVKAAAEVMAECQKTLMETGKAPKSPMAMYLMYLAVSSPVAERAWETGTCTLPPHVPRALLSDGSSRVVVWDLDADPPPEHPPK